MKVSLDTLAELPPEGPWAALALALASRGKSFTVAPDPAMPVALGVLEGVKVELEADGDGGMEEGLWEVEVGPLEADIAAELGVTACRSLGGNESYWRLVVHWSDEPKDAVVSQVWVRDELAKSELGHLDSFLAAIVYAAVEPEGGNLTFVDGDLASRVVGGLRQAAVLRAARRAADPAGSAALPVTGWERAVSDAPDDASTTAAAPEWASGAPAFASADALLTSVLDDGSFADLGALEQERALWALDRRARFHVRTGRKPARGLFPPKAISEVLRAAITSADDGVAGAAWWALATLEVAGPKKKSWLERVANEPEAVGLDAELVGWARSKPSSPLTRLGKIRRPTPSSRLAAILVSRSGAHLDTKDSERVSKHVPTAWSLSSSITHGSSLGVYANRALEKNAPHPPSLAERLVEMLEERPCDPAELGLTALGRVGSVPDALVARLRILAATRVELACLLARLCGVSECEAELLRAIDRLDGSQRQWGLALKLLFEREDWTDDDRADLLVRAALSRAPIERSIVYYLGQLDAAALGDRGRSSIDLLATHESQEIAAKAGELMSVAGG